eukprot:scaffold11454_cov168-Amphora_coffeaeformis.AAC.4
MQLTIERNLKDEAKFFASTASRIANTADRSMEVYDLILMSRLVRTICELTAADYQYHTIPNSHLRSSWNGVEQQQKTVARVSINIILMRPKVARLTWLVSTEDNRSCCVPYPTIARQST